MSSRHAGKIISSLSKFQRISVQNKSAYEGPESKYFSWLPFGWKRASYKDTFDGNNDTFNSTGIVADSIFVYANPEAASLQQERILSDGKSPAERMLDQQSTHSHPKLKELHRRRCGLPINSKEVKDTLTDEQKKFIDKHKRDPNCPPNLDNFKATVPRNYSFTGESVSGNQRITLTSSGLPYWAKAENYATTAATKRSGKLGAHSRRNKPKYWVDLPEDYPTVKTAPDCANSLCESNGLRQTENTSSLTSTSPVPEIQFYTLTPPPKVSQCPFKVYQPSLNRRKEDLSIDRCNAQETSELRDCKRRKRALRRSKACNEKQDECDPSTRLFKNVATSSTSPISCPTTPFTSRMTEPGSSAYAFKTARRFYSEQTGTKGQKEKPQEPKTKKKDLGDFLRSKSPNECPKNRSKCDPNTKPFRNATQASASPISCPSTPMTSRISEPGSLTPTFKIPRRFYSEKKESDKKESDKKPKKNPKPKKDVDNFDYFNTKSPNECPPYRSKCDPKIKPYRKGAAKSSTSPVSCPSTPMASRIAEPGSRPSPYTTPSLTPSRFFSKKAEKPKKACFEPKKIEPKVDINADMKSPVACGKDESVLGNRCERAKCGPSSIECEKPPPIHAWKCPKKPKVVRRRKKKVKVVGRQVLLGYKVCKEPPKLHPFQCNPKAKVVKKTKEELQTPKKCPCFAPLNFEEQQASTCKKMPNAVEPDCNRKSDKPSEPFGKCNKEQCS